MRYSRQELIIGKEAQKKLCQSTIAIVGLGALGSVASEILARAGTDLILIDRDIVELDNLQRQVLYSEKDIGFPKAIIAQRELRKINSNISISSHPIDLSPENIEFLEDADLILDCTDNLNTRYLINDFCKDYSIPWIYAGAIKTIATVMPILPKGPCFNCIFKESKSNETCSTSGILAPTSFIAASLQTDLAIKILTNQKVSTDMIRFDTSNYSLLKIKTKKRNNCSTCNNLFEYLEGVKGTTASSLCGKNMFQIKDKEISLRKLKLKLSKLGSVKGNQDFIIFKNITIFSDGRALIKAKTLKEAKSTYSKFIGN